MENKTCSKCKEEKSLESFYKQKRGKYGVTATCKLCQKEYSSDPEVKERKKEYYKEYYSDPEAKKKRRQAVRKHRAKPGSTERIREYNQRPEIKKRRNEYQKNKRRIDEQYKLAATLRARIYYAVNNGQKVGSAVRDLGCSIEELKIHLEAQFQPGMSWDNWTLDGWHIDHIKPLSSFDLTDREQFLEACRYTNLQPLWAKDNLSKSNR